MVLNDRSMVCVWLCVSVWLCISNYNKPSLKFGKTVGGCGSWARVTQTWWDSRASPACVIVGTCRLTRRVSMASHVCHVCFKRGYSHDVFRQPQGQSVSHLVEGEPPLVAATPSAFVGGPAAGEGGDASGCVRLPPIPPALKYSFSPSSSPSSSASSTKLPTCAERRARSRPQGEWGIGVQL
jgi:hypothetical protein